MSAASGRVPSLHERCHEQAAESYDHGWDDRGMDARHDAVQAFLLGVAVTSALFALLGVLGAFS